MRLSLAAVLAAALVPSVRPRQAIQAPRSVFVEDYTWPELRDAIAAGATTVLIYAGSVEESGPHLVLGKHNLRARAYAERIARALDHTLVAPIIPAAPTGGTLMRFPGTIDVRPATFAAYAADIARSLASAGFRYVVLAGDHAGDQAPLRDLAPRLDAQLAPRGSRVLFAGDGFAKAATEIEALARSRHLRGSGHGGLWDTAELWAVAPGAVRVSLLAAGDTSGSGALDARGVAGDPRSASPELGREFGEIRVRDAVAQIRGWRASFAAPQRR
jgi:creatinine amidohydrolase/Fe(II)-dependent formamide hydrolase-like protein